MSLFAVPYLLRVLLSLGLIVLVNKYTTQLHLSLLSGVLCLALWTGHGWQSMLHISVERLTSFNAIFMSITLCQVIWFSSQMVKANIMKELVEDVRQVISPRAAMAALPAVVGLLPMPGGAVFSAPLVDDFDSDKSLTALHKTQINYWFRHIWEYWWPLYPGVILATEICHLSMFQFIFLMLPLSIISIIAGYFMFLKKVVVKEKTHKFDKKIWLKITEILTPVIIIVIFTIAVPLLFPTVMAYNKYLPMITGILCAQIVLQLQRPLPWKEWRQLLISWHVLDMMLCVVPVFIYSGFVEARLSDGILLVEHMHAELNAWGIPIFFVMMILPFIGGLTSGMAIGFVGMSFPIVFSLLGTAPTQAQLFATVMLAYGAGYTGLLLSPVHVCLLVSNQYFKVSLTDSLLSLLKPTLFILASSMVLSYIYGIIFLVQM